MNSLTSFRQDPFQFTLPERDLHGARVTALIGPNGSGKSRILGQIAESEQKTPQFSRTLAISNLITDSYPFSTVSRFAPISLHSGDHEYFYLGVRRSTNATFTGVLGTLLADSAFLAMRDQWRIGAFVEALKVIGASSFRLKLSKKVGVSKRVEVKEDAPTTGSFGLREQEALEQVWPAIEHARQRLEHGDESAWRALHHELLASANAYQVSPVQIALALRSRFGLKFEIDIVKPGLVLTADKFSAGEQMLISMLARVIAYVEDGSLVLIDEPETGLHPTWQSLVVPKLIELLPPTVRTHVIIATHSPHVVTEAHDVLVPAEPWGHFEDYGDPLNGRSVEQVLYRVFGARVAGNSLVEDDLSTVTAVLAGISDDRVAAASAAERLKQIAGPDTRVVNDILSELDIALGSNS